MTDYVLLIANVACVLIAFVCLVLCISCWINYYGDKSSPLASDETRALLPAKRRAALYFGIGFIVASWIAWELYRYLAVHDSHVLGFFGIWYVVGYIARFLVLVKRHDALSPIYGANWDEILMALLWAVLGPILMLHLVRVLLWEKNQFPE